MYTFNSQSQSLSKFLQILVRAFILILKHLDLQCQFELDLVLLCYQSLKVVIFFCVFCFIGSHLFGEQTQLVKTCCEEIQSIEKWVGTKFRLLLGKKVIKVYTSTRKRSNCKSLRFYREKVSNKCPRKESYQQRLVEILEKRSVGSGVGQLTTEALYITCRLSLALIAI